MLDETIVYKITDRLKKIFINAFFTVQLSISEPLLVKYVDAAISIAKALAPAVIHLTIQKKEITFMMDERFELNLVDNFKDENVWTYKLDSKALNKGYILHHYKDPTIKVLSPIVWSPEGHT